ncbi:deoR-like helix-turn-helix domain protein [Clostridioides difficile CD160]|nr:deoR-like helix-turn-helix domain protein [Clostridioides difficile CD160]
MKLARMLSIVMLLLQHNKISASSLADIFEVSKRTIYRDIEAINAAGIPIVTHMGAKGGIAIMEQYKLEKGLFTVSDITSLLTCLDNYPLSNDDIIYTIAKIKGLLPSSQINDIKMQTNKVFIDNTPWQGIQVIPAHIKELKYALEKNHYVEFQYTDSTNKKSKRIVEPYRLVLKQSLWYLQAFCISKNEFRIFRLSRMDSLTIQEKSFVSREFNYEKLDSPKEIEHKFKVKLLVDETLLGWMADFCGEENITPCENNKYIVNFPFINNDYGYGLILRFGDRCECIEPESIRKELIHRAQNLLKQYLK